MEIRKETKMVEVTEVTYVAVDGENFPTREDCLNHEYELEQQKRIETVEQFRIDELDKCMPLTTEHVDENNIFRWYEIKSKEDFELLNEAYEASFNEPKCYPELICVETCGYEAYKDDAYNYNLVNLKSETEKFWKTLGYKVTLEKQEGITCEN